MSGRKKEMASSESTEGSESDWSSEGSETTSGDSERDSGDSERRSARSGMKTGSYVTSKQPRSGTTDTEYYDDDMQRNVFVEVGSSGKETTPKGSEEKNRSRTVEGTGTGTGTGTGRKVFVMRHAERLDRIFPGWSKFACNDQGKYRPYDLNQPLSVPKRPGGFGDYFNDSPITEIGYVSAQMIGRAMRVTRSKPTAIYASAALRCVQTAHGILKTIGSATKIRVEPGLFEWMGWYATSPKWMSVSQL